MYVFNEDPWVSKSLKLLGEYSQSELGYLTMFISLLSAKGRVDMIEAGAYIGDMTIPLSRLVRRLYAFEPQEEVREVLKANLELNNIQNVEVFPYALGETEKIVKYPSTPAEGGAGGTSMLKNEGDKEVKCVELDSLGLNPSFIKADVEGSEMPLVLGGLKTLGQTRCPLFMEFDTVFLDGGPSLQDFLAQLGYDVWTFFFPMWSERNFNKLQENPFASTVSKMLLATPPIPGEESLLVTP